ncbi:MAG TPA: sugar ABC transporter permease [Chloroflexota bacterium]|jgi:multiple sugar transport system permease protein|nr:sugar ABC transporter permease [Chloroflexota bacterium]
MADAITTGGATGGLAAPGTPSRRRWRHWLACYAYLVPTIAGLLLFSAGAMIASFLMSFTKFEIVTPPVFIGLQNYADLVGAPLFWKVLGNTIYYTLGYVPLNLGLSLALAVLVNNKLRGITLFRGFYFTPVVTSGVAVAMVWAWLYNPQFGLINYLLRVVFGIQGPAWLTSTEWAMPALIILGVWRSAGYNMVIFLAGLQGIPEELYEAAAIDGAGWWARFRHVTLPMLSSTTFFVLVVSVINSFQVFEATYVMTQGGPANATLTLSYYIFQNAFEWFHMGYAAAMAWVLFGLIMVFTLLQMRLQRLWVFYR